MTFVVKVFWVLMRVAVVGVDGGVVDVGVVGDVGVDGDVDVVTVVVSATL